MTKEYYFYHFNGLLKRILVENIYYFEAADNYVKIQLREENVLVRQSFENLLKKLPPGKFVRIHRSIAVAYDKLNTVSREWVTFLDIQNYGLPVSRKYYPGIRKGMQILDSGKEAEE
jgi:DNA-binding LytR/AlgR family response regulator